MPEQEEITQQQELLATYRRTLAHLLRQASQYGGEVFAPPHTVNGIEQARSSIAHIKATLRSLGEDVHNHSDDEPAPPPSQPTRISQARLHRRLWLVSGGIALIIISMVIVLLLVKRAT